MIVVVKIGTSSLTDDRSHIDVAAIRKLAAELASAKQDGHEVVLVTSGAIAAGLPAMGFDNERPKDTITLQAASAVGQSRLLRVYDDAFAEHQLVGGQILLSPNDFFERRQYLHARETLARMLQLGVVPIVNENDAVADDEIRFGDNDRIAAVVAHAVGAELLVLLTDTAGVFTADPRVDENASLIEEIVEVDAELRAVAGGAGTSRGSGGMASKIAAARMASWAGVRTVIASAAKPDVVSDAIAGNPGVGTQVHARADRLSARKMWIAFALSPAGVVTVDDGARQALVEGGRSLLVAGVTSARGSFGSGQAVEVEDTSGAVVAKGLSRWSSDQLETFRGRPSSELPPELTREVVHRDDLVVLL
jgi:glutamate 5-kinase